MLPSSYLEPFLRSSPSLQGLYYETVLTMSLKHLLKTSRHRAQGELLKSALALLLRCKVDQKFHFSSLKAADQNKLYCKYIFRVYYP